MVTWQRQLHPLRRLRAYAQISSRCGGRIAACGGKIGKLGMMKNPGSAVISVKFAWIFPEYNVYLHNEQARACFSGEMRLSANTHLALGDPVSSILSHSFQVCQIELPQHTACFLVRDPLEISVRATQTRKGPSLVFQPLVTVLFEGRPRSSPLSLSSRREAGARVRGARDEPERIT